MKKLIEKLKRGQCEVSGDEFAEIGFDLGWWENADPKIIELCCLETNDYDNPENQDENYLTIYINFDGVEVHSTRCFANEGTNTDNFVRCWFGWKK